MSEKELIEELSMPFPEDDIIWRVGRSGYARNGNPWIMPLAYIDNRAIMDRLDAVCGVGGWQNSFKEIDFGAEKGFLCGISILSETPHGSVEWITKWDGADLTQVEAIKGGISDAMKRAGYQWGIGRYLYSLDTGFADIVDGKGRYKSEIKGKNGERGFFNWNPPRIPKEYLP